jgi:hypothetical protein
MDDSNNKYEKENVIIFMHTKYILSHRKNKVIQSKLRFFLKLYISKIINVCKYMYNIANNFWNKHLDSLLLLLYFCSLFLLTMFLTVALIYGSQYDGCGYKINASDCRNNLSFWKIASDLSYQIGEMLSWILSITAFLGIAIFIAGCIYYVTKYTMTKIYNYVIIKIYNYAVVKYQEELPNIKIV